MHAIIRNLKKKASKPKVRITANTAISIYFFNFYFKAVDAFANKVQELEDLVQQPESVVVAQAMNQLAVIYSMLGDIE